MEIKIRKATGEDYEALCALYAEVDSLHREALPHIFRKPDGPALTQSRYLELIQDPNVGLMVAEIDKRLAGFVHAILRDAPAIPIMIPRQFVYIETLGVTADLQNQGIGRRLMDAACEWGISRGATACELGVHEFNQRAIAFYEKLGYKTTQRRMSKSLKG